MNELNARIEDSGNTEYPFAVVYETEDHDQAKVKVFAQFADRVRAEEVVKVANEQQHFTQDCYATALDFAKLPHNPRHWYMAAGREMPAPKMPSWLKA